MSEQKPSVGRVVHYKLSADEARRIEERRRSVLASGADEIRAFAGNYEQEGAVLPLVIVRVWPDEFGPGVPGVNGQVLLDGNDSLWVTSAREGTEPGQWSWPPRV